MSKHWNYDEARGLKAVGTSWEEIARIFGISSYKARMRLDPVWAKARRAHVREAQRAMTKSLGKRDHVHHVIPEPIKESPAGPFMTPSGILAYRQWVPNRTALGSAPLTAKGEGFYVSLPLVSIQQS